MARPGSRFSRRRTDKGTAALEFALVFPLLIMLLIGLTTAGLTYFDHSSATNATREAARFGASADATTPGTWATSVRDRLKQTYFNSASPAVDSQLCVDLVRSDGVTATTVAGSSVNGGSCGTAPAAPASMAAGSCAVRVWMRRPEKIDLVVFPALNFDIGASAVSYYGRTVKTSAVPPVTVCEAN